MIPEQQVLILEWLLKDNGSWNIKIENTIWNYNNISQYYNFYCIFDQINVSIRIKSLLKECKHDSEGYQNIALFVWTSRLARSSNFSSTNTLNLMQKYLLGLEKLVWNINFMVSFDDSTATLLLLSI